MEIAGKNYSSVGGLYVFLIWFSTLSSNQSPGSPCSVLVKHGTTPEKHCMNGTLNGSSNHSLVKPDIKNMRHFHLNSFSS